MKKRYLVTGIAAALFGGAASAVSISNLSSQSCGDFSGDWHFVNNQVTGGLVGTLTALWSSGDTCTVLASSFNPSKSTQHFNCTASGTLVSASTNLDGKLVLSDFTCTTKEEPPKEDPPKEDPPKK